MTPPRLSLIHPTSNPFSRNAAIALAEAGWLQEIITTTAYNPNGPLANWLQSWPHPLGPQLHHELERRHWVAPPGVTMQTHPWREVLRTALVKSGWSSRWGLGAQGPLDWVYASLDRHVARHHLDGLTAVYAYEDGAAATFAAAREMGIHCIYDLPIVFHRTSRRIQQEERDRFPALAPALQATQEPAWKLERKEQEVQRADHIIVASSFTQQSLLEIGVPGDRISVIPYGAPIEYFRPQAKPDDRFRAVFVGRVGPRKGVHYLLDAWTQLNLPDAELLLVGVNEFPPDQVALNTERVRYRPSVPHAQLNQYYSQASVFVFPSLVEGFGLVLLEAMACGIPVIATPHTAAPDLITHGVEGFVVPIRDPLALQDTLEWCYRHPAELAEMGRAARRRAEQLTWATYRHQLVSHVRRVLAADPSPAIAP